MEDGEIFIHTEKPDLAAFLSLTRLPPSSCISRHSWVHITVPCLFLSFNVKKQGAVHSWWKIEFFAEREHGGACETAGVVGQ